MTDMWNYDDWQRALAEEFVTSTRSNDPITMFIDQVEMSRLFSSVQPDPVVSLSRAVMDRCRLDLRSNVFGPIKLLMAQWRSGTRQGPPPCLPLLALTVIAATEMRWEGGFTPSAYYPRLVELTERGGLCADREQLSASFDDVPPMWISLVSWLDGQPDLGKLAFPKRPTPARIGYSLSQAIVRGSDRARISSFFDAIGLEPGSDPPAEQLLRLLRLWAQRDRGLTRRFLAALDSPEAVALVLPTLMNIASAWDGNVVTTSGRRFLRFRLALDLDEWTATWELPVQEGLETDSLVFSDGSVVAMTRLDSGSRFYELSGPVPTVRSTIGSRMEASGDTSFALYNPKDVTVLAYDLREARWIEVPGIEPFVECILVIAADRYSEVQAILREAADTKWSPLPPTQDKPLIPGHRIVRNVHFDNEHRFTAALSGKDEILRDQIRPDPSPQPRLANGLKLRNPHAGANNYLAGGEPDLLLPMAGKSRRVDVTFESRRIDGSLNVSCQSFPTSDFPIPLRAKTNLEPGKHTLVADGRTFVFHIHDHAPDVSKIVDRDDTRSLQDWTENLPTGEFGRTKLLNITGRATIWAVEFTGRAEKINKPRIPSWFADAEIPEPTYFVPTLSDRVVWLVKVDGTRVLNIERVASKPPNFRGLDPASESLWRLIAASDTSHVTAALLPSYLKAWKNWSSCEI